jgi:LmbE family N-acetylglucosaminyl deacetylase
MPKTVLVLTAHPDDAEFFAGGTIARMADEGARVTIVIATDGSCGSFEHDSETLAGIRAQEAHRASQVLGAEPPVLLGYRDLQLDTLPPGVLREQFARLIRRYRPDALIAPDPFCPLEVHPDHRAVAWAAAEAVEFARLPLFHPEHAEEGLEPHFVVDKYFYTQDLEGANKIVDISATMDRKVAAMAQHKSQVAFLVEGVLDQARQAGLDLSAIMGVASDNPEAAMAWGLQAQAAQAGQRIGVAFGEAFRAVRFDPIVEALLAAQS